MSAQRAELFIWIAAHALSASAEVLASWLGSQRRCHVFQVFYRSFLSSSSSSSSSLSSVSPADSPPAAVGTGTIEGK